MCRAANDTKIECKNKSVANSDMRIGGSDSRSSRICGAKPAERAPVWRASAGGGFGPRGAKAPQTRAGWCLQVLREDVVSPPFATKRWHQKCPQGTSVGIGRRFSLSGHERLRFCGAKRRAASTAAARHSPQSGLCPRLLPSFAHPPRALAPSPPLFPHFSRAVVSACGLPKSDGLPRLPCPLGMTHPMPAVGLAEVE